MNQQDLIINNTSVVLNTGEEGRWMEDNLIILKNDASEEDISFIINYLYDEGFIQDRRIEYKIS